MRPAFTIVGSVSLPHYNTLSFTAKSAVLFLWGDCALVSTIMAAAYSEKEDSLQANNESSSSEYESSAVQVVSNDPVSNIFNADMFNANGEMELRPSGPVLEREDHAEVVASNADVPPIKIKVENVEEDECVAVSLHEVEGEDLVDRTSNEESSERDNIDKGDGPFRCEECSVAFWNKDAYLEHRSEHTHDGPIVCLDTDSQWDDLLVSTDGGQRTLCCALCGQKFSSSKGFFNHQLKHQNQAVKQEMNAGFGVGTIKQKDYECKDCGRTFYNMGQCLNHQRSHKQASKSVFHQLAQLKKKSFECPTCGRCYSRASALDAHQRCHEIKLVKSKKIETAQKPPPPNEAPGQGEDLDANPKQSVDNQQKVFKCICGKTFRALCGLGTHQRFSRGCSVGQVKVKVKVKEQKKRQFECSECEKTFVSSVALTTHQRWHKRRAQSGQPCKCKECGRSFTSLAFLNRHQKLAHSKELPAKSFLQQVCQLKKKSFECQECGCRFSRMSALQSHQLCHTDVFRNVMKGSETSILEMYQNEAHGIDDFASRTTKYSHDISHTQAPEENYNVIDVENEEVDYEIVHITEPDIVESSSGQDHNPDLELVCESDQEEMNDISVSLIHRAEPTPSSVQLPPEIDVTIVKIDYELLNSEALKNDVVLSKSPLEESGNYNCPHCDQTFVKASSLHGHMRCHRKSSEVPYKSTTDQLENLQKSNFKCEECDLSFSRLSALRSHQQNHKLFVCLQCNKSCSSAGGLSNHQKFCCGRKPDISDVKDDKNKNFNPSKSLLGPKVHHCKKCGKGFWSLGAFYHHKQNHMQCADVEKTRPAPENSHIRRKKKARGNRFGQKQPNVNSNEKYECEVCGKSYHMLGCFLKHRLVHDPSRKPAIKSFDYQLEHLQKNSYPCPDCGKVFSRAMALQFHMKSHGFDTGIPASASLPPSPEKLRCMTCQADFTCESLLQDHQKCCSKLKNNAGDPGQCEKNEIEVQIESSQNVEDGLVCEADSGKEQKTNLAKLKYKCQDCTRSFSVIGALNFHKRIHLKSYASKKLNAKAAKQLKVNQMQPNPSLAKTPFACVECGRYFISNSALGTHRRWHTDKKFARFLSKKKSVDGGPYLCNLCGKGFFYLCVLRRHQRNHPPVEAQHQQEQIQPKESFTCPDCQMSFLSGSSLMTHFAECHGKLAENDKLQCQISYTLESGPSIEKPYTSKMNIAKQDKPKARYHRCSHCPKRFPNERGLRAHQWQKHFQDASTEEKPKPPFASKVPPYNHKDLKPSTEEELAQHSQILEVTRKCFFKCDKCAKDFPSEEQLNAHKELAKSRPHSCALCCRGYWSESQLQQHLAWHDEERRRLPTELRYRLGASMTSKVKQPIPLANTHPNYKCQHCDNSFLSLRALQEHQVVHTSDEPYNCSLCPQTFSDVRDLIDHHQDCLGDKERQTKTFCPESVAGNMACIECGITFKQETDLHQHYIEHARGVV
nr:zinc finger protein 850 [Misgurnus anguillicaudatus]